MKIKKSAIPAGSLVEKYLPAGYVDVYLCKSDCQKNITPDDVMVNIWKNFPTWVNVLFRIRNFVVRIAGLKSLETNDLLLIEKCIRTGEAFKFISFPAKSDKETVLLLSDKHLNAYLSVHIDNDGKHKNISISTLVHFHNKLGRAYFFIIKPFHIIIVKNIFKRAINKLITN
ncbi:MAG: DUF2867 domain-containing protein [Prevotellaceae bacterium]|jgi:hypothetical protein|nr:DUF2867 domain-containing protein [Prevotellaceae bacterium]